MQKLSKSLIFIIKQNLFQIMKKLLKLSVLLTCVFSLTVWSCKPTKTTSGGEAAQEAQEQQEVEPMGEIGTAKEPTTMIGNCSYSKGVEGTATITQLDASNTAESIIKFSFEPNKVSNSALSSKANSGQIFNVEGVGQYPPREWAIKNGLVQGAKIPCVRYEVNMKEEQESTCSQVKYDFPQFKNNNWKQ